MIVSGTKIFPSRWLREKFLWAALIVEQMICVKGRQTQASSSFLPSRPLDVVFLVVPGVTVRLRVVVVRGVVFGNV